MKSKSIKADTVVTIIFLGLESLLALGVLGFVVKGSPLKSLGCILWGLVLCLLYFIRPASPLHSIPAFPGLSGTNNVPEGTKKIRITPQAVVTMVTCLILILASVLPMGLAPAYNGEYPQHRNQYEILARSFLHGHIYMEYDDIDPRLATMNNPYDPAERSELGVAVHSDNAYYKGTYYMYFGVVPVLILFLPYLAVTGHDLTTYHATQVFTAFAILGIFLLFYQIGRRYFKKMSIVTYLCLCCAMSVIAASCSIAIPALYCTATSSASCMMIWSIYFFFTGVFLTDPVKYKWRRVLLCVLGSFFGALAFGCRPTAALGNILLIPFCIEFIASEVRRNKEEGKKTNGAGLFGRVCIVALPYVIILALLMIYNYARFESPFEFGQSYQLTGFDQSDYGTSLSNFSEVRIVNGIFTNFIGFTGIRGVFPYIYYQSAFVNYPVLLAVFGIFLPRIRKRAKIHHLNLFMVMLFIGPLFTTFMQMGWAPGDGSAERYRMDIYYLMVTLSFLTIGFFLECLSNERRNRYGFLVCLLCLSAMGITAFFLMYPCDYNYMHWFPEKLEIARQIILLH